VVVVVVVVVVVIVVVVEIVVVIVMVIVDVAVVVAVVVVVVSSSWHYLLALQARGVQGGPPDGCLPGSRRDGQIPEIPQHHLTNSYHQSSAAPAGSHHRVTMHVPAYHEHQID